MKKGYLFTIALFFTLSLKALAYNIGHTSITFVDPARNYQNVPTEIYYPAVSAGTDVVVANGLFPYIVFGHGFMMGENAYFDLSDTLVSKGYIVIFVTTNAGTSTDHQDFGTDFSFMCTEFYSLNSNSNYSSLFLGKIDNKKAIVGHSMGGGSAILGAQNNTGINTIICLSPMGTTTPSAISAAHLVSVPTLIISASGDSVTPAYANHMPVYDSLASTCKVYMSIKGGGHCLYANSNWACDFGESSSGSAISINRAQQQDATLDFITPWLNYYLKNDLGAQTLFFDSLQTSPRITYINGCLSTSIKEQVNNKIITNYFVENDNLTLVINNALENNISVQLFNLLGEIQFQSAESSFISATGTITKTFNLSGLSHGMYLVRVNDKNKMTGFKFVK